MRIAVIGAGGVGGYFGARLAAAGEEVVFLARGAHLEAMRTTGLQVLSANGDVAVHPVNATDDPAALGVADIVLVCVKLWDTAAAGEAARAALGPESGVISFQNGVHAEDELARILGADHVMGGTAGIAAVIERPGVIRHTGTMAWLEFGELDNRRSGRAEAFLGACRDAGVEARIPADIQAAIWDKFIFLTAASGATALARSPLGPLREDEIGRRFIEALLREAAAVARAKGVAIPDGIEATKMAFLDTLPAHMKASMAQDLERANRLEVEWLSGAVCELGRELGVATPSHDAVVAALRPFAAGQPSGGG